MVFNFYLRTHPRREADYGMIEQQGRRTVLIDFHTHILPGIDDGSRDIGMTEAMLREQRRQGVDLIVATPHFYANQMSIEHFLSRRDRALRETEALIRHSEDALPKIVAGAEVYYFQGMGRAEAVGRLCVGETRTILVELPFEQWNSDVFRDVEALIDRQGLNVVLAHVERYHGFQKDRDVWNRVMALPLTPQINAGSFVKKGGLFHSDKKRKFCLRFLSEHPRTIIGSDCHNMEGRAPNLLRARREIEAALGAKALDDVDEAVKKALTSR